MSSSKNIQRPTCTKDLDVGRIVIEETSEETKHLPEVHRKEKVPSKSIEVTLTGHEVEEISREHEKEAIVKVGKLDVTCLEKRALEFTNTAERTRTQMDGTYRVIINVFMLVLKLTEGKC